jgi:NAD(P)-dependent dehydrogenase (short-subunit alcohol dehydrogenase family)
MKTNQTDRKAWFITGSSTGFGRALGERVLERGDRVVATARRPETVEDLVERYPERALTLQLDVTDPAQVKGAVSAAIERFGRLDVVVNNAGYGLFGGVEEVTGEQLRAQFETNVFGALAVTRAVLPQLRRQGSGHLLQISSVAGQGALPGLGLYCASKWALEAFSQALAAEVAPLGIGVTIIEPGAFATDFGTRSLVVADAMPEYVNTVGVVREGFASMDRSRIGDPIRAAEVMMEVVEAAEPPLRLALGGDSLETIRAELAGRQAELERWEDTSRSVNRTPAA